MMSRVRVALPLVVFIAAAGAVQAQDIGLSIGAAPPAVTIEDLDGQAADLSAVIGRKPVLLEFWATWCPQCEALFPRMEAAHRRFGGDAEFIVIAVAVNQTQRSIRRHLERHPMPFRVLWDTQGRAVRAFQAPTTSYVVVLDAGGKVVYTGTGPDQDIEEAVLKAVRGKGQ
ncbi:MAG TPA: TlpA disulfide reductase family protein [Gemmatimonadales bacterium]|nr:TlpA disulfide reductase family protein [Gemmatimonadales bacterium]